MNVARVHSYRFGYLKSEHWGNLRLSKLAQKDARCEICSYRSLSNDVHHIDYKNLFDVKEGDLVVLCREHHDDTHELLKRFKSEFGSSIRPVILWKAVYTTLIRRQMLRGHMLRHLARVRFKQARTESKRPFPKLRPRYRLLYKFFKLNPDATNAQWRSFCVSSPKISS